MPGGGNHSNISPFARALAEAKAGDQSNAFSSNTSRSEQQTPEQMAREQQLQEERQKRERLRQQLHKQVNPVETTDIFSAEKQRVKKEIDEVRKELKLMVQEVAELHAEIDISIMSNVVDPGTEGKYYLSFFQKLRELIKLLRQRIHSARTWATTMQSKKKKKMGKKGMEISGQQYEQTSTVYDRAHHERSTQYSGS